MLLLLACTSEPAPTPSKADSEPAPTLQPIVVEDAWVASLEGFWLGPADPTPDGRIPTFPMEFIEQDDGSWLSSTEAGDGGDHIDFHFRKDAEGGWTLYEEAQLDGSVQAYTTHPVAHEGATITWVTLEDPDFLTIAVTSEDRDLVVDVTLRGAQHVRFDLDRQGP